MKKIVDGKFDSVVVQSLPIADEQARAKLEEYAPKYAELARFAGSQLMLYCTWPHKGDPLSAFDAISEPHLAVAKRLGMTFVPAGPAWKESMVRRPDLQLFNVSDTVHSGLWGAYLTSCVFYAILSGKSPLNTVPASVLAGQGERLPANLGTSCNRSRGRRWKNTGLGRNGLALLTTCEVHQSG